MKLSKICIERPVFATVLSLVLLVFGYIGLTHLQTRYFPRVPEPYATVTVTYQGASPQVMEQEVTRYLENALTNVDDISSIQSTSSFNTSTITVYFVPGANLVKIMGDVRDAISSERSQLPADIDPPSIITGGVSRPVLNVGFMDPKLKPAQIRDYVTKSVVPQLIELPGMGAVWTYGAADYAMRIWLDPQRMAALGVTVTDVENALQSNNIDFSAGAIRTRDRTFTLAADTQLHTPQQFANLIVYQNQGQIVRLGDVATVALGSASLVSSPMRINGKSGIDLEIRPLQSANPITVAKEAKKVLARIQHHLPAGMTMLVTYDQSQYLLGAIHESVMTLIEAVILVMLVVYLFLGDIRAAFVPIVTIPVCVIAVFGVMLLFGFSINIMTLLAIILAIGLVVDDAIVMLENIHRHIEKGLTPFNAALKGSKEIGFSVVAMTLTLAAVYAPSGFASGFTATVFREFAFTLAGAVLISGFVALTLSPMMCSRVLLQHKKSNRFSLKVENIFQKANTRYSDFLRQAVKRRWHVIIGLVVIGVVGYLIYLTVPQSFIPKEDIGYFTLDIHTPPGSTIQYTDRFMKDLEKVYAKTPEIKSYASFLFATTGTNFVTLVPWHDRDLSTEQLLQKLQPVFNELPVIVDPSIPDPIQYGPQTTGKPIQIYVMTQGTYPQLLQTIQKLENQFKQYPGMTDIDTTLKYNSEEYKVNFQRNQAALLGVNLQDVADTMSVLLAGKHITDVEVPSGQTYPVEAQMDVKDLSSFKSLNNIYVRSSSDHMVPLSNLVTLTRAVRQSSLDHYNRQRSATINANLAPGYSLNQIVKYVNGMMVNTLQPGESFAYGGRIQAFLDSNGMMFGLFGLSILFIYLVLAAQFESFVDPLIIMLTVPLCIVGALATLKITGGSINLYTMIGMITLVGLITKHGILITQFANVILQEGGTLLEAVTKAAVIRLRPILMTTFAMVLGALPLAFATGPGSVSHRQIGWVIVGGMILGTVFSLIVVPIAYYLLARFDHKKKRLLASRASA